MLNTERLCAGCMNDNGGEKVCSICGYDSKTQNAAELLPTRYWLKERYLIGKVTESNGEGVTYIGWDNKEDQIVNVREYFPESAALRNSDMTVKIKDSSEFVFNEGLMNFLELHKNIEALGEMPALPTSVEVFEENGTAYSITKSVSGITLREFLIRNGGSLNWEQARPLFLPVLTTVQAMHSAGIIHRGISPETIIVGRDGKLRLTGICVREARMSKSGLPVQLFPGFSATEQYGFDLELRDGKYTDVYSLAATLFRVLMGAAPTDASERVAHDNLQISARFTEILPKYVLSALANGLQIMPQNRIQDIEAFRLALTPVAADTTIAFKAPEKTPEKTVKATKKTEPKKPQKNNSAKKYAIISSAVTAVVFIVLALIFFIFIKGPEQTPNTGDKPAGNQPVVGTQPDKEKDETPTITPALGEKLYSIPDFVYNTKNPDANVSYAQIIKDINYSSVYEFEFEVLDKQFSDTVPRGYVISQTPAAGQTVKKGAKIQFTLSLGPRSVAIADLSGLTREQAILELLKQGFLYENILFEEPYDVTAKPNAVIRTDPESGTKVDTDSSVTIHINTYTGEEDNTDNNEIGNNTQNSGGSNTQNGNGNNAQNSGENNTQSSSGNNTQDSNGN